ncbi:hypothetical protein FI667_g4651, partial [Globisporangium splendens]
MNPSIDGEGTHHRANKLRRTTTAPLQYANTNSSHSPNLIPASTSTCLLLQLRSATTSPLNLSVIATMKTLSVLVGALALAQMALLSDSKELANANKATTVTMKPRMLRGAADAAPAPASASANTNQEGEQEGHKKNKVLVKKIAIPVPVEVPQYILIPISQPSTVVASSNAVTSSPTNAAGAAGAPGALGEATPAPTLPGERSQATPAPSAPRQPTPAPTSLSTLVTEPPQEIPPPTGSDASSATGGAGTARGSAVGGQTGTFDSPSGTSGFAVDLNSQVGGASLGGAGGFGAANKQFGGGISQFGGTPSGNSQFGAAPGGAGTGFAATGQAGGNGFIGQGQFGAGNFGNGGGAQFGRNGGGFMNGQPRNRWRRRH